MKKVSPLLVEMLKKLVVSMGYEFVGCERALQGRQAVLRLYIDKEGGVSIDDCSKVSHQVNAVLNVEDPIEGGYLLEVSSPGIDRPLFEIAQYQRFVGKCVSIRLCMPINERKQYKGLLQSVEGEDIYLLVDNVAQAVKLPFVAIEKANVVGEIQKR
ncbi:MAG TPA: ribosome maturation factor RimP [Gammaproteobacteria bacterium]|jgi:ribosome maturation factor RimP|nr:ribosome maturation factor RimP [Gammaproteobacteria bacterium]